MRNLQLFFLIASSLLIFSCKKDECREYSDYTCKEIKKADYNVYFYFPSGSEKYLGQTKGLESCGSMAWGYAGEKNLTSNRDWGYICCMIAKGSSCYEKHR